MNEIWKLDTITFYKILVTIPSQIAEATLFSRTEVT